jgi:hypothetical protein
VGIRCQNHEAVQGERVKQCLVSLGRLAGSQEYAMEYAMYYIHYVYTPYRARRPLGPDSFEALAARSGSTMMGVCLFFCFLFLSRNHTGLMSEGSPVLPGRYDILSTEWYLGTEYKPNYYMRLLLEPSGWVRDLNACHLAGIWSRFGSRE